MNDNRKRRNLQGKAAMNIEKEIQENNASLVYCDICNLNGRKTVLASYDSKTTYGIWAYLCGDCFLNVGHRQRTKPNKEVENG